MNVGVGCWLWILPGLSALCAAAASAPASDTPDPEDELKAATVLAFLQNSKWPVEPSDKRALTVGVWGRPAFVEVLRGKIEGKAVNGRSVHVQPLTFPSDPRCCSAYYLATDRKAEIRLALAGADAVHVLTMGESDHFLDAGGAVNLFLSGGHMAFEVDLAALERSGVAISSKILRFGSVRGRNISRSAK